MATYNNGLQFDSAGNLLVTFGGGGAGGAVISAGTNSQNTGTVIFSNSNGVSFGLNGAGVLTATVTPGAAAGIAAVQLPNTTYTSGTVVFSNSNGISFGSTAGGGVTASYTVPGATVFSNSNNVSFGLNGSTVTGSASFAQSSLSFSNLNGVSFGIAGSTLTASVGAGAGAALSAAGSSQNAGTIVFSNSNGVSFGMAGSTITASANAGGSPNISAGTTSSALGSIVFSNSNGVSFGLNGSTITASASGAGASATVLAQSQTTGQSSSGTLALSAFNVAGYGIVSVGWSASTLQISGPATTNFANLSVSAGTTSGSLGSLVFSNSNGVSFGLNGSTITASAGGGAGAALSAAGSSQSVGTIVFSNSNGVSFGMNGSTITGSVAGGGGVAIAASNSTFTSGTVVLSAAGGALTISNGAQSALFSVPQTSSLSGVGGINISVNGSTISVSGPGQLSFINALPQAVTTLTQIGNGSVQVYPFYSPEIFSASRADILVSQSISSSSNSSHAGAISVNLGLYTRTGSTLSLASSGSQSYQWTNTSNNSMGSLSGLRRLSVPLNVNFLAGGDLWVAVQSLTTSSNANWFTASNLVLQPQMTAQLQGLIGAASNNTNQLVLGEGIWSTTSAALPASIAFSAITGLGSAGAGNNVYMAPVFFANVTA